MSLGNLGKRISVLGILLILMAGFAGAVPPGDPVVEVIQPTDGNYIKDGSFEVQFTVIDGDDPVADMDANIYYDTSQGGQTNLITSDLNLFAAGVCSGTNFTTIQTCTYTWTVNIGTDGNYYVDVLVQDLTNADEGTGDGGSFYVDNTKPYTFGDYNGENWYKYDQNVELSCNDAGSGCAGTTYNLNSGGNTTYTVPLQITTEGNNTLQIYSTDTVGNNEDTNTINVKIDRSAPSIANKMPANSTYTNDTTPDVNFDLTDAGSGVDWSTLQISIDGNLIDNGDLVFTQITDGNTVSYAIPYTLADGKVVHVDANANDNLGHAVNAVWDFTIDTTAPTSPSITNSYTSNWTNDETPTFTLSASDSGSGVSQMKFSCDDSTWSTPVGYATSYSGFDITTGGGCGTGDETKTIYARFGDGANNWSASANTTVKYDNTAPSEPNQNPASAGNAEVSLSWDASSGGVSGIDEYVVYVYDDGSLYDTDNTGDTDTSHTVTGLSNGNEYEFKIKARDNANNLSTFSDSRFATPVAPLSGGGDAPGGGGGGGGTTPSLLLSWTTPTNNAKVSGVYELKVRNTGTKTPNKVDFWMEGTKFIGRATASAPFYTFDWDTTKLADGTYKIKAIADAGFIKDTKEITIKIDNTDASADEEEAGATATTTATEESALGGTGTTAYAMLAYEPSEDELADLLLAVFTDSMLIDKFVEMNENADTSRKLEIIKTGSGDDAYYTAMVTLSYTNDGEETTDMQLIEVIPKEFVELTSMILSGFDFTVLSEDPVIMFNLAGVKPGETAEITYALDWAMTQEEADAMTADNVMGLFTLAPLIMDTGTEITSAQVVTPAGANVITMLVGLITAPVSLAILAAIIVILVIVMFVAPRIIVGRSAAATDAEADAVMQEPDLETVTRNVGIGRMAAAAGRPERTGKIYGRSFPKDRGGREGSAFLGRLWKGVKKDEEEKTQKWKFERS